MNVEQYKELVKTVPDFMKNYCFEIDPSELIFDRYTSQVRKKGHVKKNVPRMAAALAKPDNNVPPASVRKVLKNAADRWSLKDGSTRALGGLRNGQKILVCDYHDRALQYTDEDWEIFQAKANDHYVQQPNTSEDMAHWIHRDINSGRASRRMAITYKGNEDEFIERTARFYKEEVFENSGKNMRWFKNRAIDALGGKISTSYEQYITETAFKKFSELNDLGWTGSQSGVECNGHTVFMLDDHKRYNPNIMGGVMIKRVDSKKIKYNIVAWVGTLAGKGDTEIIAERVKIAELWDKYNDEYGCFDSLYFLPQIKTGENAENLDELIKIIDE